MKSLFDVPAPAKLNLFLHIVGRRSDGYHLLESAFMLIDWHDVLHFELRADGQISREDLSTPLPPDDLITRAARALQQASGCTQGVHIGVDKRIPAQAGMGGGSSDAASTLLALSRLWGLNLSLQALSAIGLRLGADVPFFLSGGNAWVEGVGDKITPIDIPEADFWVLKPATGLSTQQIFSHPDLKRDTEHARITDFAADPFEFGHNDLQSVAQLLCPDVKNASAFFENQGLRSRMTGSGSSVFAKAKHNASLVKTDSSYLMRHCKSLVHHPLRGWCQ